MARARFVITVFCLTFVAADLSGSWSLFLDPDFSGNQDTVACNFKQDGQKLTVNCGGGTPITGEVNDRTVTLRFNTGSDGKVTATLTGELDETATTITGTWHLSEPENQDGKFEARKR